MPPKLDRVLLEGQIQVLISEEIYNKINYLCRKISRVEWSGVLFYTVEGSMSNAPNGVKFIVKDILLMDKGTSGYTEYDWGEDVVAYQMDHPESIEENWVKGHIHSHNTMGVFFSGTDMDELNDNVGNHNVYLSLIVNNFMETTAKIVFTALPSTYTCKDIDGTDYDLSLTEAQPLMFVYDGKVIMPNLQSISEEFDNRIKQILEADAIKAAKKKAEEERNKVQNSSNSSIVTGQNFVKGEIKQLNNSSKYEQDRFQKGQLGQDWDNSWDNNFSEAPIHSGHNFNKIKISMEEQFMVYVLKMGNKDDEELPLEEALIDIDSANLAPEYYAQSVVANYPTYFDAFFDKEIGYEGDKVFLNILAEFITSLEEHEQQFTFITPIIMGLKSLGNKLEENSKKDEKLKENNNNKQNNKPSKNNRLAKTN